MFWLKIVITTARPAAKSAPPGKCRKTAPMTAVPVGKIALPRQKA